MSETYNKISDEAVKKATGRTWHAWFALLDERGASELSHKEIAAMLVKLGYIEKGNEWWAQSVTVAYEYARGRRVIGETKDTGFQLGVQKTLPVEPDVLWSLITGREGRKLWLGTGIEDLEFTRGETYVTSEGTAGEIRSVYPGERLRLTWQPAHWEKSSTLQLTLQAGKGKTALNLHHEKLADAEQRSRMKEHWREVLRQIGAKAKVP